MTLPGAMVGYDELISTIENLEYLTEEQMEKLTRQIDRLDWWDGILVEDDEYNNEPLYAMSWHRGDL